METALVSIVSLALIIIGSVTIAMNSLHSSGAIADSLKYMEQLASAIRRTEIVALPPDDYSGGSVNMTVRNEGQTNLDSYSKWDVIAQYQDNSTHYIEYTEDNPIGNNQWKVSGIYLSDNSTEVFDYNILNPGEKMVIVIKLDPEIGEGETGRIAISTPNGVTSQCLVTRELPP